MKARECFVVPSVLSLFLFYYYSVGGVGFTFGMNAEILWQFLPAQALLEAPFKSIYYLHTRPPLGNMMYGVDLFLGDRGYVMAACSHLALLLAAFYSFLLIREKTKSIFLQAALLVCFFYLSRVNLAAFLPSPLYGMPVAAMIMAVYYHIKAIVNDKNKYHWVFLSIYLILLSMYRAPYSVFFIGGISLILLACS